MHKSMPHTCGQSNVMHTKQMSLAVPLPPSGGYATVTRGQRYLLTHAVASSILSRLQNKQKTRHSFD